MAKTYAVTQVTKSGSLNDMGSFTTFDFAREVGAQLVQREDTDRAIITMVDETHVGTIRKANG